LRLAAWTGVALSGVVAALLLLSLRWSVSWLGGTKRHFIGLVYGAVCVGWTAAPLVGEPAGWHIGGSGPAHKSVWWVEVVRYGASTGIVYVALWLVLALTTVPTVFLLMRLRHTLPAGCCAICGYNLTGNVSGRCPECGTAIDEAARRPAR
jgi:hypothetical protein